MGRSTVYGWWSAYRQHGEASLAVGRSSSRPPKLSIAQTAKLCALIVAKDPRQLRFDFALWTRDMVCTLIKDRFGVEMSRQGTSDLLRRLGLSPKRHLVRAYEQDPEAAGRWRIEQYPKIAARAKACRARIFFCDEAGVRTDHHAGTTWEDWQERLAVGSGEADEGGDSFPAADELVTIGRHPGGAVCHLEVDAVGRDAESGSSDHSDGDAHR